eukprot:scaffold8361_cov118-Isochrysis_galbana.AAC.2
MARTAIRHAIYSAAAAQYRFPVSPHHDGYKTLVAGLLTRSSMGGDAFVPGRAAWCAIAAQ